MKLIEKLNELDGEAVITYAIAAVCILLAVDGYRSGELTGADIRWLLGFAVFLTSERDLGPFLGRGR